MNKNDEPICTDKDCVEHGEDINEDELTRKVSDLFEPINTFLFTDNEYSNKFKFKTGKGIILTCIFNMLMRYESAEGMIDFCDTLEIEIEAMLEMLTSKPTTPAH